jgi:RecB family exonuclease
VITPRRTRLIRVPDLAAFRATLAEAILALTPETAADTFVLVPTRAAGEQLRRTVEDRALREDGDACVLPLIGTRPELFDEAASRLPSLPPRLSAFEREVILAGVGRDLAEEGLEAPFQLRPALVAEILGLYDHFRRLGRSVADFERNFLAELEPEQATDRGARQLVQQTEFLAAVFRGYEARMAGDGRLDEHALRERLLAADPAPSLQHVVVTVADRVAEPDGLWPADFDLLTRLPGLVQLDVVSTEAALAAGFLERLHAALPELDEVRSAHAARGLPRLVAPPPRLNDADLLCYAYRDREEELAAVARRLKAARRSDAAAPLHRSAVVVPRPLPYLYLARDVFADAAVAFETLDTLPLAAEPYAAAVDLVLDAVGGDFTRTALLALIRSPHFRLTASSVDHSAIAACDMALADARYLGGLDRLEGLVSRWSAIGAPAAREERRQQQALPALHAALDAVRPLAPMGKKRLAIEQIATLVAWLRSFDRPPAADDPTRSRRLRVGAAVLGALDTLGRAYERYDAGAEADVATLTAAIRRWLGSQTFASQTGEAGLQLVDARAARYGDFDTMQMAGLIDGEWPERPRRNVLYPGALLALLEPLPAVADPSNRDRDALAAARAAFKDLMGSAASEVRLSTVRLENDAVVEPSLLLDDVPALGFAIDREEEPRVRVSLAEALAIEPRRIEAAPPASRPWAASRLAPDDRPLEQFRGAAGPWRLPRVSVSRLERYLDCPFRFFASEVLRLEEQPEDEDTRTPLERGRFLHELWERFFAEWQRRGFGRITPQLVTQARELFEPLAEQALATLSPSEAALERTRLLGSALSPGIAHRVFAMEAERPADVRERLLEYPLQGDFTFQTRAGRSKVVTLSAKVDRIDLLQDGTLRVIDYKSKKTPDVKQALQLPLYSFVALESLRASAKRPWTLAEALYLSFEGDRSVVSLRQRNRSLDELVDEAKDRMLDTLDRIAGGRFPPQPAKRSLCTACPYRSVCRLEIVEAGRAESVDE